jgi:hypothetical protein
MRLRTAPPQCEDPYDRRVYAQRRHHIQPTLHHGARCKKIICNGRARFLAPRALSSQIWNEEAIICDREASVGPNGTPHIRCRRRAGRKTRLPDSCNVRQSSLSSFGLTESAAMLSDSSRVRSVFGVIRGLQDRIRRAGPAGNIPTSFSKMVGKTAQRSSVTRTVVGQWLQYWADMYPQTRWQTCRYMTRTSTESPFDLTNLSPSEQRPDLWLR